VENLRSVLAAQLVQAKPYAIVGAVCLVVGIFIGVLL